MGGTLVETFAASPLAAEVERVQDAGQHDVYVYGLRSGGAGGGMALLVHPGDPGYLSVAPFGTCNGLGRWEGPYGHDRPISRYLRESFEVRP